MKICWTCYIFHTFKWESRHTEWRRTAKKLRRKRIRQQRAQERDFIEEKARLEIENSQEYQKRLENEREVESLQLQEQQRIHDELEAKWMETERIAQKEWRDLQNKLELLKTERAKQNAKIKEEWEQEKKKLKDAELAKQKELEEKLNQQKLEQEKINNFLEYGGAIPDQLKIDLQTNPGKTLCPFFNKTSTCRFGDMCSRNHVRPGISKVLLIQNFYSHYSLVQTENEHGNSSLEYESSELYAHFKEFFYDIVPEIEKYGHIKQIIVCCNAEIHLRGNVYIEYHSERDALLGYKSLHGRWYGGKQLTVQFSGISSWNAAICGLFHRRKCPKGSSCNFIHRFMNPKQLYFCFDDKLSNSPNTAEVKSHESPRRDWRWSESPERDSHYQSDWENTSNTSDNPPHEKNKKKARSRKSESARNHRRSVRNMSDTSNRSIHADYKMNSSRTRNYESERKARISNEDYFESVKYHERSNSKSRSHKRRNGSSRRIDEELESKNSRESKKSKNSQKFST